MAELYQSDDMIHTLNKEIQHQKYVKKNCRNSVILGLNRIGIFTYNRFYDHPKTGINLIGFIDVYNCDTVDIKKWGDVKYLGNIAQFHQLVKRYDIKHAYIAIDVRDVSLMHKIVGFCNALQIEYEFVPEIYDVIYGNTVQQIFTDLNRPWEFSLRQVFDSLLALFLIFTFFPLWFVVSIVIKLTSSGPTLYSQERVGKNGRIFRIFKFRTMYTDAEKMSGPVLATQNDPRITKVGLFLRKTRIDEIPQLINILIGDMFFIGPRPERPYFVDKYAMEIPMYKNRLKMKPGITGLAQVTTGYDTDIEDVKNKLKHDLYYYNHQKSVLFNLKILFKTVWVVVAGQGQ